MRTLLLLSLLLAGCGTVPKGRPVVYGWDKPGEFPEISTSALATSEE